LNPRLLILLKWLFGLIAIFIMFVDHVRLWIKAGDGGDGCASFRREKFVPLGGPDGGDGGDGGNIILEVSHDMDHLTNFHFDPKLIARNGVPGSGRKRTGAQGKDRIAKVPPGTLIYKAIGAETMQEAIAMERSEEGVNLELIADLTKDGEQFMLAKGGKGGIGNWHFRSSTNQTPQEFTLGTEGEYGVYYFELRQIADVGLVGFPNAGKSTLISKLSAAKPKIAAYPFTTLNPVIGITNFEGFPRITIADIPGIIEDAHQNRGLGHEFLRHVTRCKTLLFVIDMAGWDGRDPIEDLAVLRKEIKEYDPELAKFKWFVAANKMDVDDADEKLGYFKARYPKIPIIAISAKEEQGLKEIMETIHDFIQQAQAEEDAKKEALNVQTVQEAQQKAKDIEDY